MILSIINKNIILIAFFIVLYTLVYTTIKIKENIIVVNSKINFINSKTDTLNKIQKEIEQIINKKISAPVLKKTTDNANNFDIKKGNYLYESTDLFKDNKYEADGFFEFSKPNCSSVIFFSEFKILVSVEYGKPEAYIQTGYNDTTNNDCLAGINITGELKTYKIDGDKIKIIFDHSSYWGIELEVSIYGTIGKQDFEGYIYMENKTPNIGTLTSKKFTSKNSKNLIAIPITIKRINH